jgi:hypothetical protein
MAPRVRVWRLFLGSAIGTDAPTKVPCALDPHAPEESNMHSGPKRLVALFVAKSHQQWVVRDPEGNFWLLPAIDDPWGHRQPFTPTPETALEPVPGHYTSLLDLPF